MKQVPNLSFADAQLNNKPILVFVKKMLLTAAVPEANRVFDRGIHEMPRTVRHEET